MVLHGLHPDPCDEEEKEGHEEKADDGFSKVFHCAINPKRSKIMFFYHMPLRIGSPDPPARASAFLAPAMAPLPTRRACDEVLPVRFADGDDGRGGICSFNPAASCRERMTPSLTARPSISREALYG